MNGTGRFPGAQQRALLASIACACALLAPIGSARAARPAAELSFAGDGHATIPFDLRNQHMWIRGRLNGADSIWIVVDTGASASVIDEGVARSHSIPLSGRQESRGSGGSQRGWEAKDVTVEMAGFKLHRRVMGATDLSHLAQVGGRPMQFILGYELFEACVVRFDYARGVMDIWDAEHAPRNPAGARVAMTLEQNHPYVEGALHVPGRAPLRGRFTIDTGSSMAVIVAPEVTARESLVSAFPRTSAVMSRGVGGEVKSRLGRADSFSVGGLTFSRPLVAMPDAGEGRISAVGSIGNVGGQILGRCAVTFDYAHKQINFEPGPNYQQPFEADMSGASFVRSATGITVRLVNPDSPAAEAGLQVGDVITQVDGAAANTIDPAALRLMLQMEGRVVQLSVQRGSDTLEKKLTLRRLL